MATNFAKATYTEVVDMQTVDGKLSIIGIHTPVGKSPYLKLKGFFTQFRKYRYNGIKSITICPAAGLPIDPLGLSSVPGSTEQMDPRDTFNPVLFKGCHGEHLHRVLDVLMNDREYVDGGTALSAGGTSTGGTNQPGGDEGSYSLRKRELDFGGFNDPELAYYSWLTDTSWRKFGIQSVIKLRNLHPLVWKMARNMPMLPSATGDIYQVNTGMLRDFTEDATGHLLDSPSVTSDPEGNSEAVSVLGQLPNVNGNGYVQEFTSGCARLGWLPTTVHVQGSNVPVITGLPKLFMGVLVLPPCYSVNQFMRAVIVHSFHFRDFNSSVGGMDPNICVPAYNSLAPTATRPDEVPYTNWIDYGTSKGGTLDIFNGEAQLVSDGVA